MFPHETGMNAELGVFAAFGVGLFVFTAVTQWKKDLTVEEIFAAGRDVGVVHGTMSIMATWTAATAVLVAGQITYQLGLAGLFWFTLPNALGLMMFAPVALKIRKMQPEGFTIAQLFDADSSVMYAFATVFSFVRSFLPLVSAVVGGSALLTELTSLSALVTTGLVIGTVLSYSLISGLSASILTDVVQMAILGVLVLVFFPWTIIAADGVSAITAALTVPQVREIFVPPGLYFGVIFSIIVFSVPFTGQFIWQRVYAIEEPAVERSFLTAGALFVLIPLLSSVMGLIAIDTGMTIDQPLLVSYVVLEQYLPVSVAVVALVIVLTALLSTADSALVGCASILVVDVCDELLTLEYGVSKQTLLRASMVGLSALVLGSAYAPFSFLDWVLLHAPIGIVFGVAVLSRIFTPRLSRPVGAKTVVAASLVCFPPYVYATLSGDNLLRILSLGAGLAVMVAPLSYYQLSAIRSKFVSS